MVRQSREHFLTEESALSKMAWSMSVSCNGEGGTAMQQEHQENVEKETSS